MGRVAPSPYYLELLARTFQNKTHQMKQIHALLVTTGHFSIPQARPPTAVYNILIKGCLKHYSREVAWTTLYLFKQMLSTSTPPSRHTFPALIVATTAMTSSSPPHIGCAIHCQVLHRGFLQDAFISCSLVKLHAQLGCIQEARKLFDEISQPDIALCNVLLDALCKNDEVRAAVLMFESLSKKDIFSWTTLMNGLVRNCCYKEAIEIFRRMMKEHNNPSDDMLQPTEATFVCGLSACAKLGEMGTLGRGREVHSYIVRHEYTLTPFLGTALVDIYGKCGHLQYAANVFDQIRGKNVCTWNALIMVFACNGKEAEALNTFELMKANKILPNSITFVGVLTACARAKLVECGLEWFKAMPSAYRLIPTMEHYGCMVDLFGKAGLFDEAFEFIKRMPFEPDASVLGALVGACKVYGKVHLVGDLGQKLLELQPSHSGRYMVLSNIYAAAEMWGVASKVKQAMDREGIEKIAAYSLVE